ncbi:cysteine-rich motor neuron 1 protein-like [Sycon ciliatum]|uniref:cysteine-rich motor neuron 1 protein-like n=1 Tax=Sycon ciliatum TaxID=27933 RepID=UPI0031F670C4
MMSRSPSLASRVAVLLLAVTWWQCAEVCAGNNLKCPPCSAVLAQRRQQCGGRPPTCSSSLVPDVCKCCWTCAKAKHQFCGGLWHMHGRCEKGLHCEMTEQHLESVVIATTRDEAGTELTTPYLLPNGHCKGTPSRTPCQEKTCPSGTRCLHSYTHCGEFPAEETGHATHCIPVAKCIAEGTECDRQLFYGCDDINGVCWCGEKMACVGEPPFRFPNRRPCQQHIHHRNASNQANAIASLVPGPTAVPSDTSRGNTEGGSGCQLANGSSVASGTTWKPTQCNECTCTMDGVIACDEKWGLNCPDINSSCVNRETSLDQCCVICKDEVKDKVKDEEVKVEVKIEVKDEVDVLETGGPIAVGPGPDGPANGAEVDSSASMSKELVWPILLGCVGFALLLVLMLVIWKRYSRHQSRDHLGNLAYSPATAEQQHLHALLHCKTSY